ncbi:MAG: hypothetical protein V1742_04880, partial [Pseudomonadota bacterium]
NFAEARLSGETKTYLAVINEDERLVLKSRGGQDLWKSSEYFGGTMTYLLKPRSILDRSPTAGDAKDELNKIYLPSRILVTDLDENDQKELIISVNEMATTRMLVTWRSFSRGSIYSLGYQQMGMRQNWRSKDLPGALTDYQVKDFDNDGKPELIVAVVTQYGEGLTESRSTIVAYKLASPEEMRKLEKQRRQGGE